jgi:hypothetical protein
VFAVVAQQLWQSLTAGLKCDTPNWSGLDLLLPVGVPARPARSVVALTGSNRRGAPARCYCSVPSCVPPLMLLGFLDDATRTANAKTSSSATGRRHNSARGRGSLPMSVALSRTRSHLHRRHGSQLKRAASNAAGTPFRIFSPTNCAWPSAIDLDSANHALCQFPDSSAGFGSTRREARKICIVLDCLCCFRHQTSIQQRRRAMGLSPPANPARPPLQLAPAKPSGSMSPYGGDSFSGPLSVTFWRYNRPEVSALG